MSKYFCFMREVKEGLTWFVSSDFYREENEPYYSYIVSMHGIEISSEADEEVLLTTTSDDTWDDGEWEFITDNGGIRQVVEAENPYIAMMIAVFENSGDI